MEIQIGPNNTLIDPIKCFHELFDNSPNPTCFLVQDKIVDCNNTFVEKCGFESPSQVIENLNVENIRIGYDNDMIGDFTCKTVKGKTFGGHIALSDSVSKDNVKFGFIQFKWIDGFEEFAKALDLICEYTKKLKENAA